MATHEPHQLNVFNDVRVPGTPTLQPQNALDWAKGRIVLQGQWQRSLDGAVTSLLVNAIETGASIPETMRALQIIFPTFSKARLENIARTESVSAYNQGRLASFRANPFVKAVQFSAVLDARTTDICRDRDGLILAIADPRLLGNIPPLHFQCRSTLVPITRYQWDALHAGDERAEKQFFGWVKGNNAPRTLKEALEAWDTAAAPLPGFGHPSSVTAPRPSKKAPAPKTPAPTAPVPAVAPLKQRVEDAITKNGTISPDKVKHEDLARGGKIVADEILAKGSPSKAVNNAQWIKNVLDTLGEVSPTGAQPPITYAPGSQKQAKAAIGDVFRMLPSDWAQALADNSKTVPMDAKIVKTRSYFGPSSKVRKLRVEDSASTILHEIGHWIEDLGYQAKAPAQGLETVFGHAMDFLKYRTAGDKLEFLRNLVPGGGYEKNEKTRKDKFASPYIGKDYGGLATEITSMGLQGVLWRRHSMWDTDPEMIYFILGMLSWIR